LFDVAEALKQRVVHQSHLPGFHFNGAINGVAYSHKCPWLLTAFSPLGNSMALRGELSAQMG
jgi:hypothetical protein